MQYWCPLGTIYTSVWPTYSVSWPLIYFIFNIRQHRCRYELIYVYLLCCKPLFMEWRLVVVELFVPPDGLHGFSCFFLVFRRVYSLMMSHIFSSASSLATSATSSLLWREPNLLDAQPPIKKPSTHYLMTILALW